jgi:D-alanine-D-alanine ligase
VTPEPGRGFIPVLHGASNTRPDEADQLVAAEAVAEALTSLGYLPEIIGLGLDLRSLQDLAARRPATCFNLVDALAGEARLAANVPVLLERLKLDYTGAGSAAWLDTLSKIAMKRTIASAYLPTPAWSEDGKGLDEEDAVIVKPVFEHGSLGLDENSVVAPQQAPALIAERTAKYHTPHFAEKYVAGREFNVSLLQKMGKADVLPIGEISFEDFGDSPAIVGYDAKWTPEHPNYAGTPRSFGLEQSDPALAQQLKNLALRCWSLFGLAGYARVDFRVDASASPTILEVNVNPCLSPDAGFAAAAAQAGFTYERMVETILTASFGALRASA